MIKEIVGGLIQNERTRNYHPVYYRPSRMVKEKHDLFLVQTDGYSDLEDARSDMEQTCLDNGWQISTNIDYDWDGEAMPEKSYVFMPMRVKEGEQPLVWGGHCNPWQVTDPVKP